MQADKPPDNVPKSKCVLVVQIPEPDEPGSVTPEVHVICQCVLLPPEPMQLLTVVNGFDEKLMHLPSAFG